MSFGKMNSFIEIISTKPLKDSEGFSVKHETVLASVRAYKEERRGNEISASMTTFSEASVMFRFRVVPNVTVTESLTIVCENKRYRIIDVQNGRGHGMYIECLCSLVEGSVA